MGQVALGLRSLLFKLVIFFVMAALLAWALGGTLWPRTEIVSFEGVTFRGQRWHWQMLVGGKERGHVRWQLMSAGAGEGQDPQPIDGRQWAEVAPRLVVSGEWLFYACRATSNPDEPWRIERTGGTGASGTSTAYEMPDRLAVEQQLARVREGLEVQDADVIRAQRGLVIDPPVEARGPE